MSDQQTLVTFVLDRTTSMGSIKSATIESFNSYLQELRKSDGIKFSLIQFATDGIEKTHFEADPKQVPDLNDASYTTRGATNLIQTAMLTIQALDKALAAKTEKPKVVVCIQTDGEENSSPAEYTWQGLKNLIDQRQKDGWQFNFMGAGIDAYQQAAKMGVMAANTMSYDPNDIIKSRAAFTASAGATLDYHSGAAVSTSYSMGQKLAAGDTFDPKLNPSVTGIPPVTTGFVQVAGLDLTTGVTPSHKVTKSPTDLDLTSTS